MEDSTSVSLSKFGRLDKKLHNFVIKPVFFLMVNGALLFVMDEQTRVSSGWVFWFVLALVNIFGIIAVFGEKLTTKRPRS